MTYAEFKEENNELSNYLLDLWFKNKASLYPLIELYAKHIDNSSGEFKEFWLFEDYTEEEFKNYLKY